MLAALGRKWHHGISSSRRRSAMKSKKVTLLAMLGIGIGIGGSAIATPPAACQPELFGPGHFSTDKWDWRFSVGPTRLQAFWSISDGFFPITRESTIVSSHRTLHGWSPRQTASFSGIYPDIDPFVSPDGRFLFFSSIRPVDGEPRTDTDIWMVKRRGLGWGEPTNLGSAINSPGDELYPSADLWGNLYFATDRDGQFDIMRSKRRLNGSYAPAERLGSNVNTPGYWEFNPEISPDGSTLLFTGLNRPDGQGLGDLYVSRLGNSGFLPARNLGPCVNTTADEYHPTVLWWERKLVFVKSSYAPGETGDFYIVDLPHLH
jgi:hypothetical protein